MPKFETKEKFLFSLLGREYTDDELEQVFPRAKAELDEHDKANGVFKIELNDTNRPDLWSAMGLARLLKNYEDPQVRQYDFFSSKCFTADNKGRELHVGNRAKEVREFSCGFVAKGKTVDEDILLTLIQSQEKLCFNFGRKRRTIAMGIYRNNLIQYPIHYDGADPDKTHFIPLHMDEDLTLREILEKHPKGQEYGYIIKDKPVYPYLYDNAGKALSMPPVINSAYVGAVEVGDDNLFVEMSGPILKDILLCASIMAVDMADLGFTIEPVKVVYPYETEFGKEITVPYYFQDSQSCTVQDIRHVLGEDIGVEDAREALLRMGVYSVAEGDTIHITCPEYRNDFLHPVDVVEDVMIGYGLENFEPTIPRDFTVGRLTPAEELGRKVKDIMVGMGFQEMIYNYLGSRREYVDNMHIKGDKVIMISNPMSENFEAVRPSIIPSLLESESVSGHATYPHRIFEVGKVAYLEPSDNSGTVTRNSLGFMSADGSVTFNDANSFVNTLMYFLRVEYTLAAPENDSRFIAGRCANIVVGEKKIGIFGEVHPAVLESWGCGMPAIVAEIDLDCLL
ncbi:MAG: phenylalanine--tRNA ligase subunit beta [Spirochaetales bacterium]|nr:phenylalanine--tRNA ligase subunit beta [Spirochaetales bacterium]MBQ5365623.1 phenylalanine--tRNA ligase subunit beta [Spirochaetales bacterium]